MVKGAEKKYTIQEMEQAYREMQMNLFKYKESVAQAIAYEKRTKRKYEEALKKYNELTEQAKLAAKKSLETTGREKSKYEKLAKRALQLRAEMETTLAALKASYENAKNTSKLAQQKYNEAAEEIEKRARQLKEARILDELNKSRRELVTLSEELDIDSAAKIFDEGLERVQTESEKLEALDKLSVTEGERLDKELEELTRKTEIDRQFEELLAEVGGGEAIPEKKEKRKAKEKIKDKEIDTAIE